MSQAAWSAWASISDLDRLYSRVQAAWHSLRPNSSAVSASQARSLVLTCRAMPVSASVVGRFLSISGNRNLAVDAAIVRSQAVASAQPMPIARPVTTATTANAAPRMTPMRFNTGSSCCRRMVKALRLDAAVAAFVPRRNRRCGRLGSRLARPFYRVRSVLLICSPDLRSTEYCPVRLTNRSRATESVNSTSNAGTSSYRSRVHSRLPI